MDIVLSDKVEGYIRKGEVPREEVLDAAVLPDIIREAKGDKKEFLKRSGERFLKLTVLVERQRTLNVVEVSWVEERKEK